MGKPLALKPKDGTGLTAGVNLELACTIKGRHFYFSAKGSLGEVEYQFIMDIIAVSGEELVLLH